MGKLDYGKLRSSGERGNEGDDDKVRGNEGDDDKVRGNEGDDDKVRGNEGDDDKLPILPSIIHSVLFHFTLPIPTEFFTQDNNPLSPSTPLPFIFTYDRITLRPRAGIWQSRDPTCPATWPSQVRGRLGRSVSAHYRTDTTA
ncbi:hypothetical protein Pcinc_033782 [Petrolisthes cinctipes]|uniref:Uncharacterized protein n=1 Tax=Petrolisthes cinctipes TaxID=88211 RepID=A0AAE1ERK2_PETCI|nr:hypothetical protein Pcinc_033782 [Petrolisthes cinctipes]